MTTSQLVLILSVGGWHWPFSTTRRPSIELVGKGNNNVVVGIEYGSDGLLIVILKIEFDRKPFNLIKDYTHVINDTNSVYL